MPKHRDDDSPTGNVSGDEVIPDDYFAELGDSQFLNTLEQEKTNDSFDEFLNYNKSRENSPATKRRLDEIARLTESIDRQKKKIRNDLFKDGYTIEKLDKELEERKKDSDYDRNRNSRERISHERGSREHKRRKKKSRSRSSSRHRSHRSRSPERKSRRYRNHSNDRHRGNRSRSRSPKNRRSSSTHKTLSFLEELAQTFAEKGQAFPEKDLLLNNPSASTAPIATTSTTNNQMPFNLSMPVEYQNPNVMHYPSQAPINPMIYPTHHQQYAGPPMYYGINPMTVNPMVSGVPGIPPITGVPSGIHSMVNIPGVPSPVQQPIPPGTKATKVK